MNLFIATGIFHPEAGGPATYLLEVLPEFQRLGWDLRVLTYGEGDTDGYGYPLSRIPRRTYPLRLIEYGLAANSHLAWADVIYIHTLGLPLWGERRAPRVAKIVGDVAWERAIRKGWVAPTTDIDNFQLQRMDNLLVEFDKRTRAAEAQRMDAIIVPSEYLKRMVEGWGVAADRIHVVYNAISDGAHGSYVRTRADARISLGFAPELPLLLTAARLTPWKGVQHLIAALRDLPEVRLLVAGDGQMLPELQAVVRAYHLEQRVTFLGHVRRELMPTYIRAADYLALYSGYEGLSHTLLEALREGTPVIASDKGGNREIVRHGVNGFLAPYVDVEALSAVLREAYAPGVRDRLAATVRDGIERFSFENMVAQTASILANVKRRY